MKKILLLAIFTTQIISCGIGTIEVQPESTKLKIINRSSIDLSNVMWRDIYDFGNINAKDSSKYISVSEGKGTVSFYVAGKKYYTCGFALAEIEKYGKKDFALGPSTPLENSKTCGADFTLGQLGEESNEN